MPAPLLTLSVHCTTPPPPDFPAFFQILQAEAVNHTVSDQGNILATNNHLADVMQQIHDNSGVDADWEMVVDGTSPAASKDIGGVWDPVQPGLVYDYLKRVSPPPECYRVGIQLP